MSSVPQWICHESISQYVNRKRMFNLNNKKSTRTFAIKRADYNTSNNFTSLLVSCSFCLVISHGIYELLYTNHSLSTLPCRQCKPGGIFQTRVYGFDGLQTRVPGLHSLLPCDIDSLNSQANETHRHCHTDVITSTLT